MRHPGGRRSPMTTACCCISMATRHGQQAPRARRPRRVELAADRATAGVRSTTMRLIGVTGGIATGKSTVDRMLAAHGAAVIDADELAREAVRPGEPALAAVAARFGSELIRPDGSLDRPRLGEIVFADPEARRELERITHPRITELIGERIAAALAGPAPLVAVDIPLLFENSRESLFEGVLLVYASPEGQLEHLRLVAGKRGGVAAPQRPHHVAGEHHLGSAEDDIARELWIDTGADLAAVASLADDLLDGLERDHHGADVV